MMSVFERPKPILHDPAIYWLEPSVYAESSVSYELRGEPMILQMLAAELEHQLTAAIQHEVLWAHYTTRDEQEDDDLGYRRIHRRRAFEQPGYTEIVEYQAQHPIQRLMIPVDGIVTLDLRRLMYHGERLSGALHDGVLYVVRP